MKAVVEEEFRTEGRVNGRRLKTFLILLGFTSVSVFCTNRYSFGSMDHSIEVPFLKWFLDPTLYPDDLVVAQRSYLFTYFGDWMGLFVRASGWEIPAAYFAAQYVSAFATFYGFYRLSYLLFTKEHVALLSLFFLLFPAPSPASTLAWEPFFCARNAALPFLFWTFCFFFERRWTITFSLIGVAFLLHPLSAVYVLAMILVACVIQQENIDRKELGKGLFCMLVILSPLLIRKWLHSPESLHFIHADPEWVSLLRLRSPHHLFPFSWNTGTHLRTFLLLVVFFFTWKHVPVHHRSVKLFLWTILALCALGTVFAEIIPVSIVIQLQFLRSFRFLIYFAMMYLANYCVLEISGRRTARACLVVIVAGILALYGVRRWEFLLPILLLASTVLFGMRWKLGTGLTIRHWTRAILGLALVIGAFQFLQTGLVSPENSQEAEWVDVQKWAKLHTPKDSMFITPPFLQGFRVDSERSVYVEWKDGTQMFFHPEYGKQWMERMKSLGYYTDSRPEFTDWKEEQFQSLAADLRSAGPVYAVTPNRKIMFEAVYRNDRYAVYRLPGSETVPAQDAEK